MSVEEGLVLPSLRLLGRAAARQLARMAHGRLAAASCAARLPSPLPPPQDSHLCLHPRFGAWWSLRCVAIFDGLAYAAPPPPELRNPLPPATSQYVRMTLDSAVNNTR